jgi:hypothetical protein
MSKGVLQFVPSWMQSSLSQVFGQTNFDHEVAARIQIFCKSVFDLLKNAMAVGVLHYLTSRGQSTLLQFIAEGSSLLLIIYCVTYIYALRSHLAPTLISGAVGSMLNIAIGIGISVALLMGVSVGVESAVHEIARLQRN